MLFSHPHVRSRLEKLMGSNIARITDRRYMQRLQERIQEDHVECLEKRIKMREADEIEREKKLFLDGKVPVEQAPKELCEHPVFRITQVTKKLIDAKRCRESIHSSSQIVFMRSIMEDEDEVDVGAGEAAAVKGQMHQTDSALSQDKSVVLINIIDEKGSLQEFTEEKGDDNESQLQVSPSKSEQDDIAKGYMFTQEEYDRLKYESPLVKQLRKIETVEEMYRLADEIVGPLKTLRRK